jgi:hypothetical protein
MRSMRENAGEALTAGTTTQRVQKSGANVRLRAESDHRRREHEGQLWVELGASLPLTRTTGIGASRPFPCVPTKVR